MLLFFQFFLQAAGATTIDLGSSRSDITPIGSFSGGVEILLSALMFIAALLTFGYMVWGGVDWIISQGDSGKVESARKKITHAIIGLAVLASTVIIYRLITSVLGVDSIFSSPSSSGSSTPRQIDPCQNIPPGQPC